MKEDKKEDIYFCFKYRCKNCPRKIKCDEENKKNEKSNSKK